jgi:flagellar motor switch protein FliG
MSKQKLDENIINKFIDGVFNSYKKGIEKRFIDKAEKRNPELAKKIDKVVNDLDDLEKYLKRIRYKG